MNLNPTPTEYVLYFIAYEVGTILLLGFCYLIGRATADTCDRIGESLMRFINKRVK